jgi:multidrug efflux pump subunit AcrA (membrane-fusion protein)
MSARRREAGPGLAPVLALVLLTSCRFGPMTAGPGTELPPTAPATRSDFALVVEEVGVLRARASVGVAPPFWGKILEVAPEGQVVAAGDVVFRLDTVDLERRLERAEADARAARSQLDKALERIALQRQQTLVDVARSEAEERFAEKKLQTAEDEATDADRQLALALISERAADEKRRALRQQRLETEQARLRHRRKEEEILSRERQLEVDRHQAERRHAQVTRSFESLTRELAAAAVRAPADGTTFLPEVWLPGGSEPRKIRIGDQVGPWVGAVVELPDLTTLEVRTQVDEALYGRLREGLPARVAVPALAGLEVEASVSSIGGLALRRSASEGAGFAERVERDLEQVVFPVTLSLGGTDARLQPGLTVAVSYVLDTVPDAVSVPGDAVLGAAAEAHVFVARGTGWERRTVRLGPTSGGRVVVLDGLEGGELVYLGDPSAVGGTS